MGKTLEAIIRVHEFYKVEQVVLCEASHQTSVDHHEELTQNAEELMRALRIPYHVVVNCGGDLGLGQVKNMILRRGFRVRARFEKHTVHLIFMIFRPDGSIFDTKIPMENCALCIHSTIPQSQRLECLYHSSKITKRKTGRDVYPNRFVRTWEKNGLKCIHDCTTKISNAGGA